MIITRKFDLRSLCLVLFPILILQLSCNMASSEPTDYFTYNPDKVSEVNVFRMVVVGDSIAWGEGLNREQKYYYLVAQWLYDTRKIPVEVTVYAHNGATLGPSGDPHRFAECGSAAPSLLEQASMITNPDKIDLILVSGGINDVNVMRIINSDFSSQDIKKFTEDFRDPMIKLLNALL